MPKGKKGFQPGNQVGATRKYKRPVGKKIVTFRVYADQEEAIAQIEGLAEKLREYIDELISEQRGSSE